MNEIFIPIRVFRCYNKIFLFYRAHLHLFDVSNKCGPETQQFKDMLVMKYVKDLCIFERSNQNIPKFAYIRVCRFI